MKKFAVFVFILFTGFIFSACSSTPPVTTTPDTPTPIPTLTIKAEDPADQKLMDELNQYQDPSFDKDFADIESQF